MSNRVDGMGTTQDNYEKKFQVTDEWCLAINNIEYVRQSLQPFTDELGMEEIIQKLSDLKSPLEAQRCQRTLDSVIDNAIDTVRNEIIELLETVVSKVISSIAWFWTKKGCLPLCLAQMNASKSFVSLKRLKLK